MLSLNFLWDKRAPMDSWIKMLVLRGEILARGRDLKFGGVSMDGNTQGKCHIMKSEEDQGKTLENMET